MILVQVSRAPDWQSLLTITIEAVYRSRTDDKGNEYDAYGYRVVSAGSRSDGVVEVLRGDSVSSLVAEVLTHAESRKLPK